MPWRCSCRLVGRMPRQPRLGMHSLVEDNEIIEAIRLCYEILKVAVEPSGAIGLATVLSDNFRKNPAWRSCKNIGIILSVGHVYLGVLWDSFIKWKLKCSLHRNQILGDIYF
ncbi:hypothetical protein Q3G72_015384 [Acer saccharum]|nr:hypothetical protein Q3G72_015384 [Acer saccharum]